MAIRYVFKADEAQAFKGGNKADPQKLGEALAVVIERNNGYLTPAAVVDAARDRKSVLHQHFEWDDTLAAQSWRIDQARSLIRCINIVSDKAETGTMRAFLSIKDSSGVSYRTAQDVLSSADLQSKVLAAAERDLLAFEARYRSLEEICDLLRMARETITERRKKVEAQQGAR